MIPVKKHLSTDVLVVGGGIAGLSAAISARASGVGVLIAEKANTLRSGSGATGNDHFLCYIPEKHGPDVSVIVKELHQSMMGASQDVPLSRRFLEKSFDIVKLWHSWGINMRIDDDWTFMGHAFPGRPRIFLKYEGDDQKPILTREAKKAGADILNHHMIVDLFRTRDGIAGALALDVSGEAPSFAVIRAKCVILATGSGNRLYTSRNTPGTLFNTGLCPGCTASAQAQAWRIGATLVNMEQPVRHAGPRYFTRVGKATWIGIYRYPDGRLLGPFVTKATKELGDITSDVWNSSFSDVMHNGTGPAYIDCSDVPAEDLAFMRRAMASEGLTGLVNYMDEQGIDPARHAMEFGQFEPQLMGHGVQIDINGETDVPGLFAAGDAIGNCRADLGGAAVYGWIYGEEAAKRAAACELVPEEEAEKDAWLAERMAHYSSFHERASRHGWQEVNRCLQQIMSDYANVGPHHVRSENLLNAGLKYLADMRALAGTQMAAPDAHTLMRAIETLDLMDCGEILMHAARERRETRGMHIHSDFTFTNPLLNDKFLTIRRERGKPVTAWRDKLTA